MEEFLLNSLKIFINIQLCSFHQDNRKIKNSILPLVIDFKFLKVIIFDLMFF